MADAGIEPAAAPAPAADTQESKKAKKSKPSKRDKPDDAVKLGCGGLFRRKKKSGRAKESGGENGTSADKGDGAVASKAPIEKPTATVTPKKTDSVKGTVKIETGPVAIQEESRTTNKVPPPAVPPPRPPASPRIPLARLAAGGDAGPPSQPSRENDGASVNSPVTPAACHPAAGSGSPDVVLDTERPASYRRKNDSSSGRSSKSSSESEGSADHKESKEKDREKDASPANPEGDEAKEATPPHRQSSDDSPSNKSSESSSEEEGSVKFDEPQPQEDTFPVDEDPAAGKPDEDDNGDAEVATPLELPPPEISTIPGVGMEEGPHVSVWQKVVTNSMVGIGIFKRAAACSLTTGGVLGCCPVEFTPSVEQVAAMRENFENRGVFAAAGFGVADTVFRLQEETGTPEILSGVNSEQTEGVLVARSNTALIIGTFTDKFDAAKETLGELRSHFVGQGL